MELYTSLGMFLKICAGNSALGPKRLHVEVLLCRSTSHGVFVKRGVPWLCRLVSAYQLGIDALLGAIELVRLGMKSETGRGCFDTWHVLGVAALFVVCVMMCDAKAAFRADNDLGSIGSLVRAVLLPTERDLVGF